MAGPNDPQQHDVLIRQLQARPELHWGSGSPTAGLGKVDDAYVDEPGLDVYRKTDSSTWTLIGSLV